MKNTPHATRRLREFLQRNPYLKSDREAGKAGVQRPAAAALALVTTLFFALVATASAQDGIPVISEFMANNTLDGATPDWIEIYNPGSTEIDLEGWHLTDDELSPTKWAFPQGAKIASTAYLLVYASGEDAIGPDGKYHTNFKLLDQGEYLALVNPDGIVQQDFAPTYPKQYTDISYGLTAVAETYGYFQTPSPGEENNDDSVLGFVKDTTFSHKRGFYDDTFQLEVSTATPGATIHYTTDGSTPGPESPQFAAPLEISNTTIVRAYAEKPGFESTNVDTQTYIFLEGIIAEPTMSTTITQHPTWGPQMRDALLEIPSISLVTQNAIPTEPIMSPPEIPVSIEMIFPDGKDGFQADAGAERFGGQYTVYEKHALRVSFKAIYGPKKLKFDLFGDTPYGGDTAVDSFDQILLRNGSHDSLFGVPNQYSLSRGAYIRNRYFFDRQIEQGHLSMRGKFVHVYLNGSYYGHYQLMERPNADFMATHLGGEEEDYDIMKGRSGIFVIQGDDTAWKQLIANTKSTNYDSVKDYMDVDSYIDYMLLNFYGGNNHDWYPQHNWVAGRRREPGGKFKFFMWDNDFLVRPRGNLETGNHDTTGNGGPGNMLSALMGHKEFAIRLADRAQKHFFNGGMLTKERVKADFAELAERISRTIIPETARWGDKVGKVYTPDTFQGAVDWITDVNAETRAEVVIGQMRDAGLFPDFAAPSFSQHGGKVPPGFELVITSDVGSIYYTTDGSDPRLPGGDINPNAIEIAGALIDFTSIPAGSDWKYSDDGTDLGTAWRAKDFDDSTWSADPAPLGFGRIGSTKIGDIDDDTNEPYGTAINPGRHLTFYCRKSIEITGASSITEASLQIHADAGAVVYVNGTEVARDNMPDGPISFSTLPPDDGNEGEFDSYSFDHNLLVEGTNTIAVEAHNRSGSSDMVVDVALVGIRLNDDNVPIPIDANTTVRARGLEGGEWSALSEVTFLTGVPATSSNLVISEIHYHPSDAQGELSEYVELMNISEQDIDLAGVGFTQGITFAFGDRATLAPGERAVLVFDPAAFESAYGAGATILGTFTSRLADGGERLTLSDGGGLPLQSLRYNDRAPWPREADGDGYSLVLISPESAPDHELPQNWRASVNLGGSPGESDSIPFEGDPQTDLLSYALGDPGALDIRFIGGVPVIEFPRVLGADDATVTVELSSDLATWHAGGAVLLDQSAHVGNTTIMHWGLTGERSQFARLVVSLNE